MNGEKKNFSPPVVGGSSLLVIFAVLCLTIFALLSLSTVQADQRLADRSAEAVAAYYAADVQAETILAELRSGSVPPGVELAGAGVLTAAYSCPIAAGQELRVQVEFPAGLGDEYKIVRWQAVSTAEWTPDDALNVWDGEL